jgi:hypothetical protein
MIEQRGVVRILWVKNILAKDIDKEMLPTWAVFLYGQYFFMGSISLPISFASIFFSHKIRTTPRCSIVVHVFRGAAML